MFYLPVGSVLGKAGSVVPVISPWFPPLTQSTLAPGLLSVALGASPCHYKGISVDANALFVGISGAI